MAHAYRLRDLALAASSIGPESSGRLSSDVDCCVVVAKEFMQCAAEAVDAEDKRSYHRIAGQYFALSGNDRAAARAFYAAGYYEDSAKHFRAAGMFDEAVNVVQGHQDISTSVAESIISVSKLQFLRENEIE